MTTGCRFKDEDLRRLEGGCMSGRVVKLKVSGVRTWCPTGRRLSGSEPQKGREDSGARGAAVAPGCPPVTGVCRCCWLLSTPGLLGIHPQSSCSRYVELSLCPSLCPSFTGDASVSVLSMFQIHNVLQGLCQMLSPSINLPHLPIIPRKGILFSAFKVTRVPYDVS